MKKTVLASLCLSALLSACGGSGNSSVTVPSNSPVPAVALNYTDPVNTTDWRLVKDASSTSTRIVLNLVGPANVTVRGVGFNLSKGQCINFGTFPTGAYAIDTQVFELKGANPNFESFAGTAADPVLFVSAPLKSGDILSTGIFQKDRTYLPKAVTSPLVQVAIDLTKVNGVVPASCSVGTTVGLSVVKAKIIPADIAGMDFQLTAEVINKAKMADISIAVGNLVTK